MENLYQIQAEFIKHLDKSKKTWKDLDKGRMGNVKPERCNRSNLKQEMGRGKSVLPVVEWKPLWRPSKKTRGTSMERNTRPSTAITRPFHLLFAGREYDDETPPLPPFIPLSFSLYLYLLSHFLLSHLPSPLPFRFSLSS